MKPRAPMVTPRTTTPVRGGHATVGELRGGAQFLRRLPAFLRDPVTAGEARLEVQRRLARRTDAFLAMARRSIYDRARSPYRWLLARAGCEYSDLECMVRDEGVEGALQRLAREGVWVSVDELKGRRALVRGGDVHEVQPGDFVNPDAATHVPSQTAGSRGAPSPVSADLDWIRDWAINTCLEFEAWGGSDRLQARWTIPGGATLVGMLRYYAATGVPPARWFSPVNPRAPGLHPRYRWSTRLLRGTGRLCGVPFPQPEHVPPDTPGPIVGWLAASLRAGRTPHLVSYVSGAARVCEAARDAGVDISGTRFLVGGEPLTTARLATIRSAGATALSFYASTDCGLVGSSCLAPAGPDDHHFFDDLHAAIHPMVRDGEAAPRTAPLLLTTLRPRVPLVLLNASLGDRAELITRRCACPLEGYGWSTHVREITSDEKVTAGGMTFLDSDVGSVLESALPRRFGGSGLDYQLLEEEEPDGRPTLRLLVHPRVGPLDAEAVALAFLEDLGRVSQAAPVMVMTWQAARLVRVERRSPLPTGAGKVLHVRRSRAEAPPR